MPPRHTAIVLLRPRPVVVVPLLGARRELITLAEARTVAADLLAARTGEPVTAADVEVVAVRGGDVLLPSAPAPVDVWHAPGRRWHRGVRTGWVRGLSTSWRPLVCYDAEGLKWERVVAPGAWRPAGARPRGRRPEGEPADGEPVAVSLSLQQRAQRLIRELAEVEDAVAGTMERMADRALARGRLPDAERLVGNARQARDRADRARRVTSPAARPDRAAAPTVGR